MRDGHGRTIDYLRISVTDRCNFRCHYCMSEKMTFLPRDRLLTLEEIVVLSGRFIDHGVRKIRLTGGEPLVRRGMDQVVSALGRRVASGELDELTLTTNGSLLAENAEMLANGHVRRINVSLDTLDADRFAQITRGADIGPVLRGIDAAVKVGIRVKINMVALRDINEDAIVPMAKWCSDKGLDLTVIETMPLAETGENRQDQHIPAGQFISPLTKLYDFMPLDYRSSGPARYFFNPELGLRLGTITPLSDNFCADCNRLRMTTEGKIFMCLGHDVHVDFKTVFRREGLSGVDRLLQTALHMKPARHDFNAQLRGEAGMLSRHMSVTGG
jgi:cyclic pyranopterin phosphate synthase